MKTRVVIIGGGITGLACAYALSGKPGMEIVLLERSPTIGGNISTERRGGFVLDGGPDSWVATKRDASDLARELKLGPELIPTVETNRRVYIAWDKQLHAMPEGMVLGIPTRVGPMVTTGLFDPWAKLRMGLEPLIPAKHYVGDEDESVGSFIARRFGDELAERLVAPLLGGIFAGDAYSISVRAAFPQLVEAEQKYGSLVRAMREQRAAREAAERAREDAEEDREDGDFRRGRRAPSAFESLASGVGTLIEVLGKVLRERGVELRTGAAVSRVGRDEGSWVIDLGHGDRLVADDVVITGQAHVAARLLRDVDDDLASDLDGLMGYASTATVFFGIKRAAIAHPLDGSGFLVPRTLNRPMMAATWVSSKWDHRAPAGHALVRAFLGGAMHEDVLDREDDELAKLALAELRRFMIIEDKPLFQRVFRFHRASPQMHLGHLVRMRRLKESLARFRGLHVGGSGFDGAGIPDCVRQAKAIAHQIMSAASASASSKNRVAVATP